MAIPSSMNFPEFLSSLPKIETHNPAYHLYEYEGVWLLAPFLEATLTLKDQFQAQPSDIFLCSFPKTGSTWLRALAFAIVSRHTFDETTTPLLTSMPHDCLPDLDDFAKDPLLSSSQKLPIISTHNPYHLLPKSITESGSKIVYICREPKDTFTSMWHMREKSLKNFQMQQTNLSMMDKMPLTSMEEMCEYFCNGKVAFGSYWDHVLGYWKASVERPDKFLILKYEDVKRDSVFYVKKLAEFMEKPFTIDEISNSVPEKIVKMCSIETLSNLEVNKTGTRKHMSMNNNVYFRKAEIGDWKNHLTEDMKNMIDTVTIEKLGNTGLTFNTEEHHLE